MRAPWRPAAHPEPASFCLKNSGGRSTVDTVSAAYMDPDDLLQQLISTGSVAPIGGGEPRGAGYTGTKALMLAVLEDGIRTYCGPRGRARTEAEFWVDSNRRAPFSFAVVCETLGLEPEAVRAALPHLQPTAVPRRTVRRTRPYPLPQRRNGKPEF